MQLQAQIVAVKEDNVRLYEKIKYVQSYATSNDAASSASTVAKAAKNHGHRRQSVCIGEQLMAMCSLQDGQP